MVPGLLNIGAVRAVLPKRACDARSFELRYASVSVIIKAISLVPIFRTKYFPIKSLATPRAERSKKSGPKIFRIVSSLHGFQKFTRYAENKNGAACKRSRRCFSLL